MHATQNQVTQAEHPTRRFDGKPETDADRRFFALRETGYTGPIDQDGYPNAVPGIRPVSGFLTPAQTLRDAAKYLARHGWIQGCYYDQSATVFTPAACVVGAIGMVCYGGPSDAPAQNFDDPGFGDFEAALTYLYEFLNRFGSDPYRFNDSWHQTADNVIAMLNDAARKWDRLDGGAA